MKIFPTYVKKSLVYDPYDIDPELINVDSTHKYWNEWLAISEHVASFKFHRSPGRNLYFLIKNKKDNKNLGIIDLGADFLFLGPRDKYIGWTVDQRKQYNRNIANISMCVPTQPFGFNMTGGKLLTLLAISDEVASLWKDRYGDVLVGTTVTSLYGKGVQYNRLKYFKYLGKTKGTGTNHIDEVVYKDLRKVVETHEGIIEGGKFTKGKNSKISIIRRAAKYIDIDIEKLTTHGVQRGIYWADRGNTIDFLTERTDTFIPYELSMENLVEYWRDKWAINRVKNLKSNNRFIKEKVFF